MLPKNEGRAIATATGHPRREAAREEGGASQVKRTIVHISEERCNGCGRCARACHEGAIAMVDGKARLIRDDYCDGLGDCLPACPTGAITFTEREAAAYDEQAVAAHLARRAASGAHAGGCPGSAPRVLHPGVTAPAPRGGCPGSAPRVMRPAPMPAAAFDAPSLADVPAPFAAPAVAPAFASAAAPAAPEPSQLAQWPCQIKLVPVNAPYFRGAELLVAADCTAFAYASLHSDFMAGRVTLIGCPKLDAVDYADKLTAILASNDVRSVTVVRMEVPCCGGLSSAVQRAVAACGRDVPLRVVTVSCDGRVLG